MYLRFIMTYLFNNFEQTNRTYKSFMQIIY